MKFKENKRASEGGITLVLHCLEKNCMYQTTSGTVMYDHLRITHNFMLFEDRPAPGEKVIA